MLLDLTVLSMFEWVMLIAVGIGLSLVAWMCYLAYTDNSGGGTDS